jgi:transposase
MTCKNNLKQIAANLAGMNMSIASIARAIGVHRTTLWRWQKAQMQEHKPGGRPAKLLPKEQLQTIHFLETHPCSTLRDIQQYVATTHHKTVSLTLLHNLLRKTRISRKRVTKHYAEQSKEKVASFLTALPSDATHTWLALDECGFVMNHTPTYGYSKKGTRVVVSRPGPRGQRYSLALAVSAQGVAKWQLVQGGLKATDFLDFIKDLPTASTLCMDNASIHHATKSLERQGLPSIANSAAARSQRLVYLPAYSPQLNPAELCFNVIRSKVMRDRPRTYAQLTQAVTTAVEALSATSCAAFFRHCWGDESMSRWCV